MFGPFTVTLPEHLLPQQPDLQDEFLWRLFRPQYIDSFNVQASVSIGLVALSVLSGSFITVRRILHGEAWLLKVYHTRHGRYWIPNSFLPFLLVEGTFAAIWIAFVLVLIRNEQHGNTVVDRIFVWRTVLFIPLFIGAWLALCGTLSSFPDALRPLHSNTSDLFVKAFTFNTFCWVGACIPWIPMLPLAYLSHSSAKSAFDLFINVYPTVPDATKTALALEIWLKVTRAYWYLAIALLLWGAMSVILFILFPLISHHVMKRIELHILLAVRKYRNPETFFYFQPPLEHDGAPGNDRRSKEQDRALWALRIKNLQRIKSLHLIQGIQIQLCITTLAVAALWSAFVVYSRSRENDVGRTESILWLLCAWAIAAFAISICVTALTRSDNPALSQRGHEDSHEVQRVVLDFGRYTRRFKRLSRNSLAPSDKSMVVTEMHLEVGKQALHTASPKSGAISSFAEQHLPVTSHGRGGSESSRSIDYPPRSLVRSLSAKQREVQRLRRDSQQSFPVTLPDEEYQQPTRGDSFDLDPIFAPGPAIQSASQPATVLTRQALAAAAAQQPSASGAWRRPQTAESAGDSSTQTRTPVLQLEAGTRKRADSCPSMELSSIRAEAEEQVPVSAGFSKKLQALKHHLVADVDIDAAAGRDIGLQPDSMLHFV